MAEELGLTTTLVLGKKKCENLEFDQEFLSDNESIGFDLGMDTEGLYQSDDEGVIY